MHDEPAVSSDEDPASNLATSSRIIVHRLPLAGVSCVL
jgi:hypothetical protein